MAVPQSRDFCAAMSAVPDPCKRRGRRYAWPMLLTVIAAVLQELTPGRVPIAANDGGHEFGRVGDPLRRLRGGRAPPRPTPEPVTAALHPSAGHAIDGKAVRGATRHGATVHLVSLVRHADGRVWGQVAVADKSNEITAALHLLARRNLHGTVSTMDALHTQWTLATQTLAQGCQYLMVVKANQPEMLAAITACFANPPLPEPGDQTTIAVTCDKGHDRLDLRTLECGAALNAYLNGPGIGQVLRRTSQRVILASGVITEEITSGVTNLPPGEASAAQVEALWRGQWTIENRVHYVRAVT